MHAARQGLDCLAVAKGVQTLTLGSWPPPQCRPHRQIGNCDEGAHNGNVNRPPSVCAETRIIMPNRNDPFHYQPSYKRTGTIPLSAAARRIAAMKVDREQDPPIGVPGPAAPTALHPLRFASQDNRCRNAPSTTFPRQCATNCLTKSWTLKPRQSHPLSSHQPAHFKAVIMSFTDCMQLHVSSEKPSTVRRRCRGSAFSAVPSASPRQSTVGYGTLETPRPPPSPLMCRCVVGHCMYHCQLDLLSITHTDGGCFGW